MSCVVRDLDIDRVRKLRVVFEAHDSRRKLPQQVRENVHVVSVQIEREQIRVGRLAGEPRERTLHDRPSVLPRDERILDAQAGRRERDVIPDVGNLVAIAVHPHPVHPRRSK